MLRHLKRCTIATKLPLMIVGAGGLVGICVGIAAYMSAVGSLEHEAEERMSAILGSHKANLEAYLASIEQDLRVVAENAATQTALTTFTNAWQDLGERQEETLQDRYIASNPHPT